MNKNKRNELVSILIVITFIIGFIFVSEFSGMVVLTNFTSSQGYLQDDYVRDVFIYKKDFADNVTSSWYLDKGTFPDLTYLAVHDKGLDIIDANAGTRWMSFNETAGNILDVSTFNSVTALDSSIYIGSDNGLYDIDFKKDTAYRYNESGYAKYSKNITRRNDADGYGDLVNAVGEEYPEMTNSMVLWMHFNNDSLSDEGTDYYRDNKTIAYDYSFNMENGTFKGNPVWNCTDAKIGGCALTFDGVGDYIDFGDNSDLEFGATQDFSVSLWFRSYGNTTDQDILISHRDTDTSPYIGWFFTIKNDSINVQLDSGAPAVTSTAIATPIDGDWYHTVFTADRDGNLDIYVDGVLKDSNSITSIGNINQDEEFTIGRYSNYNGRYFNGTMDEVAIFNRSLTSAEVYSLYANKSALYSADALSVEVNNESGTEYVVVGHSNGSTIINKSDDSALVSRFDETINLVELNKTSFFYANGTDLGRIINIDQLSNGFTYTDLITLGDVQDIEVNDTDIFLATNNSLLTYGMNDLALNINYTGNQSGEENNFTSIALNGTFLYVGTYGTNGAVSKINLSANDNTANWTNDDTNESLNNNFTLALDVYANASTRYLLIGSTGGITSIEEYSDITGPTVSLVTSNQTTFTASTQTLQYNVTDASNVTNCSLFIDDAISDSSLGITKDTTLSFTETQSDGTYTWNVQCGDEYNNLGNSTKNQFTVSISTSSTGGDGGSGSGSEKLISKINKEEPLPNKTSVLEITKKIINRKTAVQEKRIEKPSPVNDAVKLVSIGSKVKIILYKILIIIIILLTIPLLLYIFIELLLWKKKIVIVIDLIIVAVLALIPLNKEIIYFAVLPLIGILIILNIVSYCVVHYIEKRDKKKAKDT